MPGARRTRGLVCNGCRKCAHEHTGTAEAVRHSLRNGLTAYAVVSPEPNSSGLRHCRLDGASIRLDRRRHRQLGTSHGCQDHTVLPYANGVVILRAISRSRVLTSPCSHLARRRPRVHRIPPRVRDDRDTPLVSRRDARKLPLIWGEREADYFCADDWTTQISLNLLQNLDFTRNGFLVCRDPKSSMELFRRREASARAGCGGFAHVDAGAALAPPDHDAGHR